MSIAPKRLMVPQNTVSPAALSTGRDSPVIIDWSTEVSPLTMTPSTGTVSPGRIRSISPWTIFSAGIISSFPSRMRRPCVGARLMSFFSPFFARFVVASSKSAPIAMMKATSPAANRSPMAMAANMAMVIKRADEIFADSGIINDPPHRKIQKRNPGDYNRSPCRVNREIDARPRQGKAEYKQNASDDGHQESCQKIIDSF